MFIYFFNIKCYLWLIWFLESKTYHQTNLFTIPPKTNTSAMMHLMHHMNRQDFVIDVLRIWVNRYTPSGPPCHSVQDNVLGLRILAASLLQSNASLNLIWETETTPYRQKYSIILLWPILTTQSHMLALTHWESCHRSTWGWLWIEERYTGYFKHKKRSSALHATTHCLLEKEKDWKTFQWAVRQCPNVASIIHLRFISIVLVLYHLCCGVASSTYVAESHDLAPTRPPLCNLFWQVQSFFESKRRGHVQHNVPRTQLVF